MTDESAVKVCVRVRPVITREESQSPEPVHLYWRATKHAIQQVDEGSSKSFGFDRVFSASETTGQLYEDIARPLVVSAVEGYNGTIFAYGQTSSGKTFTMMGGDHNPGVIPLAMADVFKTIKNFPQKEFLLRVSYMEIYNETVTDLLCDRWKRKPLEIREGNYKNVYVADLTEELVTSPEQALSWINKGEKNRHYGKTKMNERSSRSHTIFRMILESRDKCDPASAEYADGAIIVSHLNLVDLAGTERASQTGAEGARLKEGCNINRSLFTLGQVIKKLSDETQKGFLNYRDSKLTRILQNSLGGNAKAVIICTVTAVALEETLSTLQFASAAKCMKNDPHVTEVSDEGALLKRYRTEIVDLRRRLQEVSSVTQTTATERESLCQLLQEKDQLQREQEDRIKNLTKLLVTSSNVTLVPKVPKRRMTWGGQLLRSAHLLNEDAGLSNWSFAEPNVKKRMANLTLVTEQGDDEDEFDSQFDFTSLEEPQMDMEMSAITVRNSSEGGLDSTQMYQEIQKRQKVEQLNSELELKVSNLQKMLDSQAEMSEEKEANQLQLSELRDHLMELQQKLDFEVQQRQKTEEEKSLLELKVTDLEKSSQNECAKLRRELEEAIQLCENVYFDKDAVSTERDLIRHSLESMTTDIETLRTENASLQKDNDDLRCDLEERREAAEFEKLEQESKIGYEKELEAEIFRLQKSAKESKDVIQKLQTDLTIMSVELQKKADITSELQSFPEKNLMDEVKQLRRSLDDAELLSLETKREWAFLRTENISLKEKDAEMTKNYEKMECEVKVLQTMLDEKKSCFKQMQGDLQKELTCAFKENTRLTALLDGKVPKDLTDNLVLEKTVGKLQQELYQCHEREHDLQQRLEEMNTRFVQVNQTQTVVCDLSEEPCSVPEEPNAQSILTDNFHILAEGKSISEEHATSIEKDAPSDEYRNKTEESNSELTSEPKSKVPAQTEALLTLISEERDQLQKMLQDLTEERDQLKMDIEENIEMMIESQTELRDYQAKVKDLQGRIKSLEGESKCSDQTKEQDVHLEKLQEKINKITVELRLAVAEKDRLLAELHKFEQTKSDFVYLTEENNRNQESVKQLEVDNCHMKTHLDEKSEMILNLSTQLSSVQEERDALSSALSSLKSDRKEETSEALDQLLKMKAVSNNLRLKDAELTRQVTDMSQQIHDHQADVQLLRQEKDMLLAALEEANLKTEEVISRLASLHAERDMLLCENTRASQQATDVIENQKQVIGTLHDERDLLRSDLHVLSKERDHLKNELEMQMQQGPAQSSRCVANTEELLQEILNLSTQLSSVQEERDALSSALSSLKSDREEETSLARDQLLKMEAVSNDLRLKDAELTRQVTDMSQQIHDHQADVQLLRQEKDMLLAALEEANLKTEEVISRLASLHAERDMLLCENTRASQQATDVIENLKQVIGTLHDERNLLQSDLHVLSKERDHLKNELDMQMQQGPAQSSSCVANTEELLQEIQQLKEELNAVTEQKNRLQTDLQYNLQLIEKLHKEFTAISAERDCLTAKRDSACNISNVPSLLDGGDLQEILNGVRKLVNLHGEGKREAPLHSQSSTESQKDLDKIQALCKELESLKNESVTLRKDLQEAAKTSRTYQELLHITKEELRQQQKESTEMMSCSTERESKLQSQLKHMNEELLALTSAKDQLDAETLNMQSNLTSLTKEKNELQILLEGTRQKNDQLRHDLQTSEETRIPLTEKLGSLTNQLEREKTNKEQVLESLQDITKERDQLKQDLALKIQDLAQFKSNSEQLANQNILLEAEVHSLNQSFQHSSHTSNLISQIQASIEKIQETFVKLQLISSSQHKTLSELNREENTLTYQLLRSVPIPERKVIVKLVNETTLLNDVLASVVVLYRRLAHHCKAHFERKLQQDVASFEKSQLQDLLDHMTQAPLSLSSQQYDYQQTCDLRLSHLLHGNQLSLQKLECILVFLEGGLAKHAISVSKVHQHCICAIQQFRNVLESSNPDAVVQMFKRIVLHRAELREDLNQFYIPLIDACNSELRLLQSSADPDQRLPTLLQNSSSSKTKAELPQENLRQSPQLQTREQTEVNMKQRETIAQSTEETTVRSCDASSQSEGVVTIGQTAEDFEAAKDKLVKMELELIAVKTSHKNEVAQLHTVLEHRAELIRKLKESLRENQQDHEQSYIDVVAEKHDSAEVKEKRVEELHRKTIQLERHVSNQQAEIDKWKRRAYKLKETKKVTFHTPVKHQAPLTKTESNSTKTYLDSPKSKFFDVSASVPVSFNHPAQFFDNSTLGSAPDSGSKMVRLPTKPDATGKATEWANECPTQ